MTNLRKALPLLLLIAVLPGILAAQADCSFTYSFTGSSTQTAVSNLSGNTPCVNWRLTFSATGTLSATVTFQTAPDAGTWTAVPNTVCSATVQPPCVLQGVNPMVGNQGMLYAAAYGSYVRVVITNPSGSGTGTIRAYGAKGASATALPASGGGGGGTGTVTSVFGQTPVVDIPVTTADISTPADPVASHTTWYTKAGTLCALSPGGTESCTGGGGGSGTVTHTGTLTANAVILGNGGVDVKAGAVLPADGTRYYDGNGFFTVPAGGGGGSGVLFSGPGDPGVPIITAVQSASATNGNGVSVPFLSNVTAGNLLVTVIGDNNQSGTTTVSDTLLNSWTQSGTTVNVGGNYGQLWYAVSSSSGADTITVAFSGGSSYTGMSIAEFSGDIAALDVFNNLGSLPAPVTTTTPSDLVVSGVAYNGTGPISATPPTVILSQNPPFVEQIAVAWQIPATAGAVTPGLPSQVNSVYMTAAWHPAAIISPGNNGDWYLNLTTGVLWGPKTGGVWAPSGWQYVTGGSAGSASTVTCWKSDGKTLGFATVAEITVGTCH